MRWTSTSSGQQPTRSSGSGATTCTAGTQQYACSAGTQQYACLGHVCSICSAQPLHPLPLTSHESTNHRHITCPVKCNLTTA
mmetsp:Transcript_29635/g.65609  ORF Transcript_29635/g.65609 Transcript_29635/m.65609 type:complete len:82 (-) Transcript_29635:1221-1466(-)